LPFFANWNPLENPLRDDFDGDECDGRLQRDRVAGGLL
jgi:hypothetical protein